MKIAWKTIGAEKNNRALKNTVKLRVMQPYHTKGAQVAYPQQAVKQQNKSLFTIRNMHRKPF